MMLSKIKAITVLVVFTTIISIKGVNIIDTYCAKLWPHYSADKKDLEAINAYIAKAEENKKNYKGSTWTMKWYDFCEQHKAQALETCLVNEISAALERGEILSDSTYKFMDWHVNWWGNFDQFEKAYAKNVTRAARKAQASLAITIIACVACAAAYKFRKEIAEKLKDLKQRFTKKSKGHYDCDVCFQ